MRIKRRLGPLKVRTVRALGVLLVATFVLCADAVGHGGKVDQSGCHFQTSTSHRHCHPERAAKVTQSVCNGRVPAVGDENVLYGRVTSVHDGDTFNAKIQGAVMKFRMADIDAPELDQPYGRQSRGVLTAALDGKDVVMLRVDNDPYSRLVVQVWIANLHINREVMRQGAAWFDREYAHDDCLFQVENNARDAMRGIWKLPAKDRVEPWVWRKEHKKSVPAR